MMRTLGRVLLLAVAAAMASETVTLAQGPGGNMPFSSTYRRPTVSPYTMMATGGMGGMGGVGAGGFNPLVYQQLVRPREDQEQQIVTQMQQGRQLNTLQNRVQQIQRDTTARQVSNQIRPTGHGATYQNLSHFYPGR